MQIRKLHIDEQPPIDLLLLADPSEKLVKDYMERGECFVAEISKQTIGVYVLLQTRPATIEIINIAVEECCHGKGMGKQLVMDAIKNARLKGFKTIEIGTGNSSIDQLALYQKCGFRITGIDKNYFIRNYTEEIFENGIQCCDMIRLSQDL